MLGEAEASPVRVFDPGGVPPYETLLLQILNDNLPISKYKSAVVREGLVLFGNQRINLPKVTLDSGASSGNYIGRQFLDRHLSSVLRQPCKHRVRLGDGKTYMEVNNSVSLEVQLYDDEFHLYRPIWTSFYVVDTLGDEVIIGLPDLLGNYFEFFSTVLNAAARKSFGECNKMSDSDELQPQYFLPVDGEIVEPWSRVPEPCPEEDDTPDPLSFSDDILRFMEMSVEESRKEYFELLQTHVSEEMKTHCPKVMELLSTLDSQEIFAPSQWNGMNVPPAEFKIIGELPSRLSPKVRPIRSELYNPAKQEFDRLMKYMYEYSNSPWASPLVIAAKATYPFIRFCGDYRPMNKYISIPQELIPIVQHELMKAAKFKLYVDLDMTNSFHQIPLSEEFRNILSIQTPWGLVRPKFLPEGVGPASGLLQHIVRDIFADFAEWTIVIFDNFLILADDYEDAYDKLKKVLDRCKEKNVILKMKKSWIGVRTVTFFGYEVTHGKWRLSEARKAAIAAVPFPKSPKEMQSFLGAALFFHHHVPNYSEWNAKLYETTHTTFVWDPGKWDYDYVGHFEKFKAALQKAAELHFPDYSLPWILRCDASEYAVGAVLFQERVCDNGDTIHEPIAFSSKRFSQPATKWDTYKREAYAIYHGVNSFSYHLKGKSFIVETDHRNLQWIEYSSAPIVVRWRVLLQSYPFIVRHIPGKENKVADYLSRMGEKGSGNSDSNSDSNNIIDTSDSSLKLLENDQLSFDSIMQSVHGGRKLHFGTAETWRRAKQLYPLAHISIDAVRNYVKECPICQKTRDTGISGLKGSTLSLKPLTYRRVVGIDHVTVTPRDKAGNTCVILIVEHFAHFPQAYAVKDYSSESVARVLFKHYCTFGMFDMLASDPGSALMSEVVGYLNKWLGIEHKVSLIGRHESNGCEGSGKQFLRHLRTLVFDERLIDQWSDDTVLPLINFSMASFPTSETGGFTPFQLKYGTQDAEYFRLPDSLEPGEKAAEIIHRLDENLKVVRSISLKLQQEIVEERKKMDKVASKYEHGDLILWNPREKPSDFLQSKLSPNWSGPYEVVEQVKNDIKCVHVVSRKQCVLHVGRVKPFIGSYDDAVRIAKLDQNQYHIVSINYYTGNPHIRNSMLFNVSFEDGSNVMLPYSNDLADSEQFNNYIQSKSVLYPLRYTASEAKKAIASMNKLVIVDVDVGMSVYLDLRYFDGIDRAWFDSLDLPEKSKTYVVSIEFDKWVSRQHTKISAKCRTFNSKLMLTSYDVYAFIVRVDDFNVDHMVIITPDMKQQFPKIFG